MEREPVQLAADVIREAVTCDRAECTPSDHLRYVTENMRIASERTAASE
ncbi:hypothetical protein GTY86_27890 [Streptomyces sp. SID5770]|nr:hypothetical protein [Streptomyces sp. SID5770]MZE55031.1 hypothetical protein [Streptomyces sp. SID5770]